ncbi:MAG: DNA mismatch repair endonuclease MutL [Lentimicrobiaceae bacterium]|nr:DNA mismatch repair endonuclease MutL [Lentimicrobiaceae bacterium]MCB9023374.1 DNA mismatch repair endonuclease MutL [Lentimicrobiaceae bacterium]MCO5266170.1 DNA mismatch repair endonuclease MutL [Lentimicrobium sp.]
MSDIIRLLPDSVANQIAAGEVVQRPASAVKELLENAIDSGADHIELIIKDAGKSLIQVIDNGCGMSTTDARMSFERHATSKIKSADDLFKISTFGFRGEALASIAAIAQVELKSRRMEDELGTHLIIEGSTVRGQQPCACPSGTSIMVKNLFFNVPARRNFLKSDPAELRHIIEEFQRVVLVNPDISFHFINNGKPQFQLAKSSLKQRIANVLGNGYLEKLLLVEQETDVVKINGYIGKPESARRTRGEQYFFANNRFIKHPYLNHAVEDAFQQLIPEGYFPTYFIFMTVNPADIDINIHPTKTEVNFQNHQTIYAMLRSAVKQTIGKYSLSSTLDFEAEQSFNLFFPKDKPVVPPGITIDTNYNPFVKNTQPELRLPHNSGPVKQDPTNWERIYDGFQNQSDFIQQPVPELTIGSDFDTENQTGKGFIQFQNRYIVSKVKSGLMIIDQQAAHERVLFEKYLERIEQKKGTSQHQLFPQTVKLSAADTELVNELIEEISLLGFIIEPFGLNTFIINGTPADLPDENIQHLLENVLENYKMNQLGLKLDKKSNLARSMAKNMAIKPGKALLTEEMQSLVDDLFACQIPNISPSGKTITVIISADDIEKRFNR